MEQQEPRYTVSDILDRFERDYVPSLSPRTQRDYARHCRDLRRWFGHHMADELKPRNFHDFMNVTKGKIQRNKQLAVLSCQGDILSLTWTQVDRVMGRIRFRQSKTGKRVGVKITPVVDELLAKCRDMAPAGEHVIRRRDGQRYTSDGFRAIWQRYQRRWAKTGNERFTYHDLRARAAAKCKSPEEAMLLLGHQNINMTRRVYDRAEREVQPAV